MLPIGDITPTRGVPVVVWSLIAVNIGVFAYQAFGLQGCEQQLFAYRWATIPREVRSLDVLTPGELDGLLGDCAAGVAGKDVLVSLLSAMFLHGGLVHLVGNLVFLAVFGDDVEARLGHVRFLLLYVVGGTVASLAFIVVRGDAMVPLVGASGAIAAVLGAYLIRFPRARILTLVPFPLYLLAVIVPGVRIVRWLLAVAIVALPAWLLLSGWFLLQATSADRGLSDVVAYEAHVAGFVAGIVLVVALERRGRHRGRGSLPRRDGQR